MTGAALAKWALVAKWASAAVLSVTAVGVGHAGGANWNLTVHSAPRAPQVMLYIGRPVGGGVGLAAHSFFGFRVDQVHVVSNAPGADGRDGLQQKELLRWQFERDVDRRVGDMHLDFGRNVTWDVTRRAFGPRSVRETYAVSFPSLHGKDAAPSQSVVRPTEAPRPTSEPRAATAALFAGMLRGPVVREHAVQPLFVIRPLRRSALQAVNP